MPKNMTFSEKREFYAAMTSDDPDAAISAFRALIPQCPAYTSDDANILDRNRAIYDRARDVNPASMMATTVLSQASRMLADFGVTYAEQRQLIREWELAASIREMMISDAQTGKGEA